MPQEFHVLQCYICNVYQVDIVKKILKWSCKMCGAKQSVKKIYSKGSAKECRLLVQELNQKRVLLEATLNEEAAFQPILENYEKVDVTNIHNVGCEGSKWLEFMMNSGSDEKNTEVKIDHEPENNRKKAKWNDYISENSVNVDQNLEKDCIQRMNKNEASDNQLSSERTLLKRKMGDSDSLDLTSSSKLKSVLKEQNDIVDVHTQNMFDSSDNYYNIDSLLTI